MKLFDSKMGLMESESDSCDHCLKISEFLCHVAMRSKVDAKIFYHNPCGLLCDGLGCSIATGDFNGHFVVYPVHLVLAMIPALSDRIKRAFL